MKRNVRGKRKRRESGEGRGRRSSGMVILLPRPIPSTSSRRTLTSMNRLQLSIGRKVLDRTYTSLHQVSMSIVLIILSQRSSRCNRSRNWPSSSPSTSHFPSNSPSFLTSTTNPRRCPTQSRIQRGHHFLWSSTGVHVPSRRSSCHAPASPLSRYGCPPTIWLPATSCGGTNDAPCSCCGHGCTAYQYTTADRYGEECR